ncbi:MAG: ATPase, T2SS/T4P/T4SS family, partial [Anaerolineales bacterium]|nr:ATPase, T2SS/T4P/T4SS family [Anaerolineales bacterium]
MGTQQRAQAPERGATPGGALAPSIVEPSSALATGDISRLPAVQAVEMVSLQAVKRSASDVHFVPTPDSAKVLFRVDGTLHEMTVLPLTLHETMLSRIKVMAGMDISEKRRPQDGSFTMQFGERKVDFRVATVGTTWGEMMVMRVLDRLGRVLALQDVGLDSTALIVVRQLLSLPHGLVMVSGPTGSGKTTTLYAAVMELVGQRGNIMTIEDPVEYRMDNINQIPVNVEAGIDFASGLKSIMRLNPDVILVGEMRDAETAKTAVNAALTGHLVLTTIHANDASSAI